MIKKKKGSGFFNIFRSGIMFSILLILSSPNIFAGEKTGTTSAAFLKINPLPIISAMGNSYTSLFLGAGSMACNPAGMAAKKDIDMILSYNKWIADISNSYLGFVYNSNYGSFGISVTSLSTDDMAVTTPENALGTGENFKASEYAFGLSYSQKFTDKLSLGLTVKAIKSYLYNNLYSDAAFAFDIGTIYGLNEEINFGIALKNLGTDVKYINESYNLPASLSIGLSGIKWLNEENRLLWAVQVLRYSDSDENYSIGLEYGYKNTLFLRAGYKFAFGTENGNNTENISCGLGFNQDISGFLFKLDYSFTNYKYLPGVHKFSLQIEI